MSIHYLTMKFVFWIFQIILGIVLGTITVFVLKFLHVENGIVLLLGFIFSFLFAVPIAIGIRNARR